MHRDATGGSKRVNDAVDSIHRQAIAPHFDPLKWKHDFSQSSGQSSPLEQYSGQRMESSELLEDVFGCTPRRFRAPEIFKYSSTTGGAAH